MHLNILARSRLAFHSRGVMCAAKQCSKLQNDFSAASQTDCRQFENPDQEKKRSIPCLLCAFYREFSCLDVVLSRVQAGTSCPVIWRGAINKQRARCFFFLPPRPQCLLSLLTLYSKCKVPPISSASERSVLCTKPALEMCFRHQMFQDPCVILNNTTIFFFNSPSLK